MKYILSHHKNDEISKKIISQHKNDEISSYQVEIITHINDEILIKTYELLMSYRSIVT